MPPEDPLSSEVPGVDRTTEFLRRSFLAILTFQIFALVVLACSKASMFLPHSAGKFRQYVGAAAAPMFVMLLFALVLLLFEGRITGLVNRANRRGCRHSNAFWFCLMGLYLLIASAIPNASISLMLLSAGVGLLSAAWSIVKADIRPVLVACFPVPLFLCLIISNMIPLQGRWGDVTHRYGFPSAEPLTGPGGRLIPNLSIHLKGIDGPEARSFITNSEGFRNEEEFGRKRAGEVRILNLGDSFSIGFHLDQNDFLGPLLQQNLRQLVPQTDIEVMNAEISDPAYGLYYLQHYGFRHEPDYVILGLCGNDAFQAYLFAGPGQRFVLTGDGRLEVNRNYDPSRFKNPASQFAAFRYPTHERKGSKGSSWLAAGLGCFVNPLAGFYDLSSTKRLSRWLGFDLTRNERAYERLTAIEQANGFKYLFDGFPNIGFFLRKRPLPAERMYETTFDLLAAFGRDCNRQKCGFAVLYFPTPFEVMPEEWKRICARWGLDPHDFDLGLPRRRIADFCRNNGILLVDPTFSFSKQNHPYDLFLPGDAHLTSRAHRILSAEVSEAMISSHVFSRPQ